VKMRNLILPVSAVLLAAAAILPSCARQPQPTFEETRIRSLGQIPDDLSWANPTPNCDGTRFAATINEGDEWYLWVDGKKSPAFQAVGYPVFSPDGKRLAYSFSRGSRWVKDEGFLSLPDKHLVGGWHVSCDGVESRAYENVSVDLFFSPDSRHCYFTAGRGDKGVLVIDGKEDDRYDFSLPTATYSDDGKRFGFTASRNDRELVVIDGKECGEYDDVKRVVFSPDGRRTAWLAERDDRWFIVLDGKEGRDYDGGTFWSTGGITFSPDSKRVAYTAKEGRRAFLVCDGQETGQYDEAIWPEFSPDSRRVAFLAHAGGKKMVVCDGKEGPRSDFVGDFVFSPDSTHVAYVADRNVVCDDFRMVPPGEVESSTISMGWVGSQEIFFSPDSKHLAFVVSTPRGDKKPDDKKRDYHVVIDGVRGPPHDYVCIPPAGPRADVLRFVVADKSEAWLVEVPWPRDRGWSYRFEAIGHEH